MDHVFPHIHVDPPAYKRHRPVFLRAALRKHGLRKVLGNETSHRNSGFTTRCRCDVRADRRESVEAARDGTSSCIGFAVLCNHAIRFGRRCSSVVMLQSGSVRRMSCRSTTTWLSQRLPITFELAQPGQFAMVAEGSALRTESTTAGAKTAHEIWAKRCRLNPAPTWMHPTVDCICTTPKRLLACSSESSST